MVDGASGISHWHQIDDELWALEPNSLESVMRTAAVVPTEIDGDCWTDLVFATGAVTSGQLAVYRNVFDAGQQRRAFSQSLLGVGASTYPVAGLGTADIDGDYRLDLLTGNLLGDAIQSWRADGAGRYELLQNLPTARSTLGFAIGDYSGDGWLDVYAAHWDIVPPVQSDAVLLRNVGEGSGTLPDGRLVSGDAAAGATPGIVPRDFNLAPAFADLDQDGDSDLLIASDFGTSRVLLNEGNQSFVVALAALEDENAAGQAVRDFDNDGLWDWFVASVHAPVPDDGRDWPWGTDGNRLYFGQSPFPFLAAADSAAGVADAEWPWGVCAEDFDNDGLTDIFVENGFGFAPDSVAVAQSGHPFLQQVEASLFDRKFSRARLYMNQGGRQFVDESAAWGIARETNGRGVACFDFDRDGDIDIAVAQNSGLALFYENRHSGADGGNFVALRLISVAPNTSAVGAEVTVVAGGMTQIRQVAANGSFQGQEWLELHFGLADAAVIERVEVRWPGGQVETYPELPVNRFLTLLDPRMLPYRESARQARIDTAITRALGYVASPVQLGDDLLLGLSWMDRIHGLPLTYSPGDELVTRALLADGGGEADRARQLRSWRRSFDAAYLIDPADYAGLAGFDALTFAGVYCHQYPLADSDIVNLAAYAAAGAQGGYDTTHALLAILWALDNDCVLPPTWDSGLLAAVVRDVYEIARANGTAAVTDLRLEAMAMLAAVGRHDLIQAAWVDQVLDAQLPGGGWKKDPADLLPWDHTTGLGLWLLLQLAEERKVLSGWVAQAWEP